MIRKALLAVAILLLCSATAGAQSLLAVPVDGEPFPARLTSVNAQGKLGFDAAGKRRELSAADLVSWGQPAELRKGPIVVLAYGGYLPGAVTAADKAELSIDSARFGSLKLPLESLAGIVYSPPPHPAELDALLDRIVHGQTQNDRGQADRAQADRLILDNGDELTGLIETGTLATDKVKIKGNLGPVEVPLSRVVGLVFNPALRQQSAVQPSAAWIGLDDGARVLAARLQIEGEELELTALSGAKWKADLKRLVFFMPQTGRAVYLSDIRPDEYRFLPYLDTRWPYKTDRNVTGGQLRCGGRLYLKGIGVHSAARLSYRLDPLWSRFQAELGIDDSTGGKGSVGFRIFVDGKQKYASPPIRGGMSPVAVAIDLAGAKRLDLVVDYGEAGDVLDHADWLNARLVK
jgi:hypothetical protein